jgi:F0F1-type ATP synthase membrane subunit c/vacuolar-type H+-ATPase subunit K
MAAVMSFVVPSLVERSAPTPRPQDFGFTLSLLRWALAEGVAVCGLVLFVLGHAAIHAWGFALAAGVLMIVHAPSADTSLRSQDLARADIKIG